MLSSLQVIIDNYLFIIFPALHVLAMDDTNMSINK